jgi:hypothetical protein
MPSIAHARYRDGMNLYQYVRSNPVKNLDPEGLCTASGALIQFRTPLAASDALRVGTPHQDLADQVVATLNQTHTQYHIVVPKRTESGPFKQGNIPYQAGGIQFKANDIVLGSFMVFMVFEICETDGPCIIESEETATSTLFPQGGKPIAQTAKSKPLRPAENNHWKKAKRLNPRGVFDTSLIVVDSPASAAVTRAIGQQPPFGFSNQISHTIKVIDKKTNKTVASGTWNVTVGVDAQGNLSASP